MPPSHRTRLTLVLLLAATSTAGTAVAAPLSSSASPQVTIGPSCSGDVVSARVAVRTPVRMRLRVRLLERRRPGAAFVATGHSRELTASRGARTYRFDFDVASLDGLAYRVVVLDRRTPARFRFASKVVPAASCAPGKEVPEAPLTLLLSLSLVGTAALFMLRRRATVT
jgi:hypothetical protein